MIFKQNATRLVFILIVLAWIFFDQSVLLLSADNTNINTNITTTNNNTTNTNIKNVPLDIISSSKVVRLHKTDTNSPKVLSGIAIVRFKNNYFYEEENNIFSSNLNLTSIFPQKYTIVEYLITPDKAISKDSLRTSNLSPNQIKKIKSIEKKLLRTAIIKFDTLTDVSHFCRYLINNDEKIELAEPYYVAELLDIPNDPKINQQQLLNTINAFGAWDITKGDTNVLIGVSDDGVNWSHEDLLGSIGVNSGEIPNNGIDDDFNGYIDDYFGYNFTWVDDNKKQDDVFTTGRHGTYVAGIIAARTNNNIGIAGVGYNCRIVPIKTSTVSNSGDVIYGYQSLIYAAIRNCKVLNCSWGMPEVNSEVLQTVVDYAISCGVAIVAAGGNIGSNGAGKYSSFYPAGYFGVLGVGEVSTSDIVSTNAVIGAPVRIVAPAQGNWSVSGENDYSQLSSGSSYAAPVVSGVLGLVRSCFPELTPLEAQELVRRSGDYVTSQNTKDSIFIPFRVNAYKSVLGEQMYEPAVILKESFFTNKSGDYQDRAAEGDTLILNLKILNVLSDVSELKLKISDFFCLTPEAYKFIDTVINIGLLKKNDTVVCKSRVIINNPENDEALCKISLEGLNPNNSHIYRDNFKIKLKSTNSVTTFRNKLMTISVSDGGSIGYSTPTNIESFGYGFSHKTLGNFIYEGGLLAVANMQKAVSTNLDANTYGKNSFNVIKSVHLSDSIGIIRDTKASASNRIGLEIKNKYILPNDSSTAIKIIISAKNISGADINDFAIGHFYDWDVGVSNARNKVEYCAECIPDGLTPDNAAAEIAYDADKTAYVGSLVYTLDNNINNNIVPQASGFLRTSDINQRNEQIKMLTSGISKQISATTDISYIVGLHFFDSFKNDETRHCFICTAVDSTKEALIESLAKCAKSDYGSAIREVYSSEDNNAIKIVSDTENLYICLDNILLINSKIELFDINGIKRASTVIKDELTKISIIDYSTGVYFLKVLDTNNNILISQKITIIR